ncbi:MAG: M28 family peptidase [Paludisphaera borealis]|uniref:M28 family metallopeptidase n=1 Tax=Paludisphaera borealis TaxID=1387353 RepID=UPI002845734C|nr:M20/M25/M40 family metallo-hydrolase [Paludisphaera borealis]MDR3618156.1 M28 family peptidase [Paludisphaera borealis]
MHDAPLDSTTHAPTGTTSRPIARFPHVATVATPWLARTILPCVCLLTALGAADPSKPERARLERWVKTLASPEFEGRRGEGGRKTAALLVEEFRRLKLEPLFQDQYTQTVPSTPPANVPGRNVGAVLRGSDPVLRDQYIVVSAHYDHLGVRNGVLYPGADDNASGVAMMMETARCLATAAERPKRSIAFIGFDLEEAGLYGSRYYVAHPPFPVDKITLFITADMIARSLGGVCDPYVFVMGTEHIPAVRPWIAEAARDRPLTVGLLGADLLLLNRSDYGPFRSLKVPFLFFSTGENPRYHSSEDKPETLNYAKLTEISQVIHEVAARVADETSPPSWNDATDHPLDEAVAIRDVLKILRDNRETLQINAAQIYLIDGTLRTLDGVIARGRITPSERASMLHSARIIIMTAF